MGLHVIVTHKKKNNKTCKMRNNCVMSRILMFKIYKKLILKWTNYQTKMIKQIYRFKSLANAKMNISQIIVYLKSKY